MPYVHQDYREFLDPHINDIVKAVRHACVSSPGILNYIITRIVVESRKQTSSSYARLSATHAIFNDAGAEFYRRMMADYEDGAIQKNGDLPCYQAGPDNVD